MVIVALKDGLGNQLFQYAVGRCLAKKRNAELKLYVTEWKESTDHHHAFYQLDKLNVKENFATENDLKGLIHVKQAWVDSWVFQPEILNAPDNVFLEGNWQSEKYFFEIRDILLKEFTPKNSFGKISAAWKEKILSAQCPVSLHVRHGDYLLFGSKDGGGVLPHVYYSSCVSELKKIFPDLTVFVFSDDLQWCKENLKLGVATEFVEGCEQDIDEMFLMSLCKHNIISRGTFSWWGAWLNQNPDKKVFSPYPWNLKGPYGKDIIPESWIKVPVDYIQPIVSIIFNVENNIKTLPLSLKSIFSQNFRAYEIILVDSSTDGSDKIYRQFAGNRNVTILKTDPSVSKFEAWNKALEVARGDYVLFLTGNDFIFPHTAKTFTQICDDNIKEKASSRDNYITSATFQTFIPNIVCFTRYLEESEDGNLDITGIQNKKFFVKSDSAFKNLNYVIELNISVKDKLMTLANEFINNSMGTKFFKRSFLNKHNIRFSEGINAELLFLLNAFLQTEKIIFVPQVFYGRLK